MQPASLERRSRAPEFYGFVAWSSTSVLFVVYLLWALLPDDYIVWLGVSWYPSREWSLLLPAYSVVLVLLTYAVYFAFAIAQTPSFSDVSAIAVAIFLNPVVGIRISITQMPPSYQNYMIYLSES